MHGDCLTVVPFYVGSILKVFHASKAYKAKLTTVGLHPCIAHPMGSGLHHGILMIHMYTNILGSSSLNRGAEL